MINRYTLLALLIFVVGTGFVSAVTYDSTDILNTSVSNSSITFSSSINVSSSVIEDYNITLYDIECNNANIPLITELFWNGTNENIDTVYICGFTRIFKFNENTGTTTHDTSGTSNNGTISGATWQTDGQTVTLTEGVDYSKTKTVFTLLNQNYLYSWIDTSYSYDSMTSDGNRNATILRLAGIVIICGLLMFSYWFIKNQMGWID